MAGNTFSRRQFLGSVCAFTALNGMSCDNDLLGPESDVTSPFPRTALGNSGLEVTTLSFGGGNSFCMLDDGEWEPLLGRALARGINYFDTSCDYEATGQLYSGEERYGMVLSPVRDEVVISTKFNGRSTSQISEEVERSLKRLRTDYLDILYIHSIVDDDSVRQIEGGAYRKMRLLRDQGVIRNIGFSSMSSPARSLELIEALDWDVVMLALNPVDYLGFVTSVLPAAASRGIGVIAMKAYRNLVGDYATAEDLFGYAMGLEGVSSVVIGVNSIPLLTDNARIARRYDPARMTQARRAGLEKDLRPLAAGLAYAQPGYRDGNP